MGKIRVLIVDDSVVVRRMVANVLGSDPALEVVGVAANGRIALAKITQTNPDIMTLDVEMPDMNGLETLAAVRKEHPLLPVIMFSTATERGAVVTLDALSLGATDYVTKPANVGGVGEAIQRLREQLIPKIKQFCKGTSGAEAAPAGTAATSRPPRTHVEPVSRSWRRVEVVAVGVSTGGPSVLATLLPLLPADFPVPALIVQHMPPVFTRLLANRLNAQAVIGVCEATDGDRIGPRKVWVAPGDYHMSVARDKGAAYLRLHQGPFENSCRPSVDVLFRSVADTYGPGALAVVLTGMGQDGLRGCERIREAGGQVLVQDEATSVVWGMPGAVVRAGLADKVLALHELAPEVLRRVRVGRAPAAAT